MIKHELDRAHLLSSLRVALDDLIASPDAEQHYDGIWQLKEVLEYWVVRLDAESRSDILAKYGSDTGHNGKGRPLATPR